MAVIPLKIRGLNVVLVVFSLLVLGGSAYYMEQNISLNPQSKASNTVQTASGKLVKKGTAAFAPCKSVTMNYALIGEKNACTALSVQASIANPLVGKQVTASGTLQGEVFYATSLTAK